MSKMNDDNKNRLGLSLTESFEKKLKIRSGPSLMRENQSATGLRAATTKIK